MHSPKVSIIIPIYNKEKYLSRCIESVLNQTFTEIECILIDDGSTDNSYSICNEYVKKDSRLKYFSQENSGPAAARCNGLSRSSCEMIMFVDADDWISNNAIEIFYYEYKKTNCDIIFNTVINIVTDRNSIHRKSKLLDKEQSPLEYYFNPTVEKGGCNKLINKKLWEKLTIPEKSRYEDFITGVQIFNRINNSNITCINIPDLYFYWKGSNNETLSSDSINYFNKPYKNIKDIYVFEWIENFINSLEIKNNQILENAYCYFYMNTLGFPYLLKSAFVTKQDLLYFYSYYKKAVSYGKFSLLRNIYFKTYYHSFFIGKLFQKCIKVFRKY